MIKKLKIKFIIINMCLVSLVLLIVFTSVYTFTQHRLQSASQNALNFTIQMRMEERPPRPEIGWKSDRKPISFTPVFSVSLDKKYDVISIMKENVNLSDEVLNNAIKTALESEQNDGIIAKLNLRFLKQETETGTKIAFADRSNEIDALQNLLIASLFVGAGGILAFFFISLFLSGWALKPTQKAWELQKQFVADVSHELKHL